MTKETSLVKDLNGAADLVELFHSVQNIDRLQNDLVPLCVNGPGCRDLDQSSEMCLNL